MNMRWIAGIDPMVRLIFLAILLASVVPVRGDDRAIAQLISSAAIFLLFLLNGLRLSRADVFGGLGNWSFLGSLVFWCFGAMAFVGWGLSLLGSYFLPPVVALGFLYLGTLPSTVQSATAYSSLAGGNVASSVVAAALLNIVGVFVTAPLFSAMGGSAAVAFGWNSLLKVFLILLLPFIIGQLVQRWGRHWVVENRRLVGWTDRSAIAIAVYVAFSGAVEQGIWQSIGLDEWAALLIGVCAFLLFAFGGAWIAALLLDLGRGDRIAFLFAGAQKSIAMGAPLATVLFPPALAGLLLLPVLVYHLLQMMVSAPLARRLALD